MLQLHTTLGPRAQHELGMILPHEHVFVDLRTPDQPGYAEAEAERCRAADGARDRAHQGAGRDGARRMLDRRRRPPRRSRPRRVEEPPISRSSCRPASIASPGSPNGSKSASDQALEDWMVAELDEGIEESGVRAGWIKLSAGDDGITPLEARILRAAARAGIRTGAIIGSHTIRGRVVMDQLDIIEAGRLPRRPLHLDPHPGGAGFRAQPRRRRARRLDRVRPCRPRAGRRDVADAHPARPSMPAAPASCSSATTAAGTIRRCRAAAAPMPYTHLGEKLLPLLAARGPRGRRHPPAHA